MDYEKLRGDRLGESSETMRVRVQAARNIQQQLFLKLELAEIVCSVNMGVGEGYGSSASIMLAALEHFRDTDKRHLRYTIAPCPPDSQ